jgi:hypothetical protein
MTIMAALALATEQDTDGDDEQQPENDAEIFDNGQNPPPLPPASGDENVPPPPSPPAEDADAAPTAIGDKLKPTPLDLDTTPKSYQVKKGSTALTLEVTPMSIRLMNGSKVAENLLYEQLVSWESTGKKFIVSKADNKKLVFKTSDADEIQQGVSDMATAMAAALTPQEEAPAKRAHGFSPAIGTQNLESPESSPAAGEAGGIGAKLKAKDLKKGVEVQLADDRATKGQVLKKAGKNAHIDFGGGEIKWVPFADLELAVPTADTGAPHIVVHLFVADLLTLPLFLCTMA